MNIIDRFIHGIVWWRQRAAGARGANVSGGGRRIVRGAGKRIVCAATLSGVCAIPAVGAAADRILLAPTGNTLSEFSCKSEFALSSNGLSDYSWFAYSSGDGIELEINRYESSVEIHKEWSMNIEYPMPTLRGLPAISFGVRDITCTGDDRGAFYAASTKGLLLSKAQRKVWRSINLTAGAGTGRIGGAYVGVAGRLAQGPTFSAELFERRLNLGIGIPLIRNFQIKATSLDGSLFYGMAYHWSL